MWPIPALLAPLRWVSARVGDGGGGDHVPELSPVSGDLAADLAAPWLDRAPDGQVPSLDEAVGAAATGGERARPRAVEWVAERAGDGAASLKQHAIAGYTRVLDPTPLAGVRPGAAVATVAGCLAIGGGTTFCVTQGVDPIGDLVNVVSPVEERKQAKPVKKARRVAAVPTATPVAPAVTPTVAPPQPSPQPTAQPTPEPTPEPTPPPAPEEEYEPLLPAATPAAVAPRTPAAAPANGPGEFDGP